MAKRGRKKSPASDKIKKIVSCTRKTKKSARRSKKGLFDKFLSFFK